MNYLILALIFVVFVFETVIDVLNYQYRKKPLPNNVKDLYDDNKYHRWLSYEMARFKFQLIRHSTSTFLFMGLLAFGFFGLLESKMNYVTSVDILKNLLFLFAFFMINFIVEIPFKYYATFVIEENYGFNKSTKKTFIFDQIKSLLLTIFLGGAILSLIYVVYQAFSQKMILFLSLTYIALFAIVILISLLSGVGIRLFNKLVPLEEGELKCQIETLANTLGFKIRKISVIDGSKRSTRLNAFFTGIGKMKEVALYDTLIEKSTDDQILAVLAHELGHAAHKDTTKLIFQQASTFLIYMLILAVVFTQESLHLSFGLSGIHFGFAILLTMILLSPISLVIQSIGNYFSRIMEYKADAFAAKHTSKDAMKSALKVLAVENLTNLTPHPLYVKLYHSHPTISERLKAIDDM